jgi:alkanesulfonate monooxygenase SsuD/methylene tetrahydromethanopterin reductase-like flavin-dependent oxidoreductase (luciferase family)
MIDTPCQGEELHPWIAVSQKRLRFGIAMVGERPEWPELLTWVRVAEALGFDSYGTPDHLLILPNAWTALAALAVQTARMRLSTLMACAAYWHPLLLAQLATDIGRISHERFVLWLGIGLCPKSLFGSVFLPLGT